MEKKIGFIGSGNMAKAILGGLLSSGIASSGNVTASAMTEKTIREINKEFNIETTKDNVAVAQTSDYLFLAVKPDQYKSVIEEVKGALKEKTIVITIAAGVTLRSLGEQLGQEVKIVRTMPNTPSLVGEGMSALCPNENVTADELAEVVELFSSFGRAEVLEEHLMDAVPAVSGSSPAYVFMFIEALADGAVKQGISREKAYKMAAQAVLGAAKMVLETETHPGALKDAVCSPGGATIEAVSTLEKTGFRASVLSAMESCYKKSANMMD
ncbi:pyrroline-5-carboxylate reductase [Rossellomorea vietnamensis]|uniref:Pyrroline-5-carboxylate reductase n=1 Tax=Rossellomorea vietnamensis TaxID=218284 RepID=A0A5D4ME63_9BACI|nr:pyrroline-5-carboxylate reductase [Rossellomorea vietnamensis]TYR99613.1 pyrroline-5-carboxylate reductase [Rossellomorea vietnamensis]